MERKQSKKLKKKEGDLQLTKLQENTKEKKEGKNKDTGKVGNVCIHCGESPCWWEKNKGKVQNWSDVCLGEEEVFDDDTAAYCRKRVRRYVSYKRWGTWNKGKKRKHPHCIKKGVFLMYLPKDQKELFYDEETLKWANSG